MARRYATYCSSHERWYQASDEERRQILDDLATGKLSSEEAVRLLQGE